MKKDLEFDLNREISEQEINELIDDLELYAVRFPSTEEIDRTIECLQAYVPEKMQKAVAKTGIYHVLYQAFNEITFLSNGYWVASAGLFFAGFLVVLLDGKAILSNNNPYLLAILLSPVPFVLGLMEVLKGREEGVIELELSCRISITQVIISRLLIISVYNIVLNSILSGVLAYCSASVVFWKITLFWLTPFTLVAWLGLLVASKVRGSYVVTMFVAAWMILCLSVLTQEKIMSRLMAVDLAAYMSLSAVGMVLLGTQIARYGRRHGSFFEGSVLNEAKN